MLQLLLKIAYKFSNDMIPKSKNNSRQQRNFIAGRKHQQHNHFKSSHFPVNPGDDVQAKDISSQNASASK